MRLRKRAATHQRRHSWFWLHDRSLGKLGAVDASRNSTAIRPTFTAALLFGGAASLGYTAIVDVGSFSDSIHQIEVTSGSPSEPAKRKRCLTLNLQPTAYSTIISRTVRPLGIIGRTCSWYGVITSSKYGPL